MEKENNKNAPLLDKKGVKTQNLNHDPNQILSNKKVFPLEEKTKDSNVEDIRIFNIFDPESGRYIRKIVKKIKN